MKIVTGSRYLGGFVGERGAERQWVKTKVEGWAESVKTLDGVARKHPQSAYASLQKSLQQEWEFVQTRISGLRLLAGHPGQSFD